MDQSEMFTFNTSKFYTPNTMDANFRFAPEKPGVYLIVSTQVVGRRIFNHVLYVGSSMNLAKRYKSHNMIKKIKVIEEEPGVAWVRFFFLECNNILEIEKSLIYIFQPKYNKQWL